MTTTKYNKNTANEGTKELGNKTLAPSGDNQHPEKTNEKECSSSSLLSTCALHPLIVKTKTPPIAENLLPEEDNMKHKKQIAQEQCNNGGLDPIRTKILHDADLMSSLCSCSYALTNYYSPRMVAISCLLLTARHHCYHLHGNNRSKISEGTQSISTETVWELLKNLFYFHGDYSSPSTWHAAASLLQRLKLLPCHYSTCHTNEENNQDNNSDELVIISNVMGEIEQFLCTNLPSPTRLPSTPETLPTLTVSPPSHSSLSITASISGMKKSPNLTKLQKHEQKYLLDEKTFVTPSPPKSTFIESNKQNTPTPPTSPSSTMPPTVTSSPSCCHSDVLTTSTPKSRQPLSCKDNVNVDTYSVAGTSRRCLHNPSENELQDKENNDSAIGMNLDITETSSKGSHYCGSSSQTNSSPSSNGSSKTSSPDSGTSTVSHTKISVPEMESLKRDFDLKEIGVALTDCTEAVLYDK